MARRKVTKEMRAMRARAKAEYRLGSDLGRAWKKYEKKRKKYGWKKPRIVLGGR